MTDLSERDDLFESDDERETAYDDECDHPPARLQRLDDGGYNIDHRRDEPGAPRVEMWGECACGAPVIAEMPVTDVRYDTGDGDLYDHDGPPKTEDDQ